MKKYGLVLFLGLLLIGPAGCDTMERGVEAGREGGTTGATGTTGGADPQSVMTAADREFMRKAATSHIQEVDLARMAKNKAQNSEIQDYAEMLEQDHSAALEELSNLMQENNVPQVGEEAKDRATMESMGKLSSAEFGRKYLDLMVQNHEKSLETYRSGLNSTQNMELKQYAQDLIPTLEEHLSEAQRLQREVTTGRPTE